MELRATFPMEESSRTNPDVITEVPENEYSRRTGETKKAYGAKDSFSNRRSELTTFCVAITEETSYHNRST